MYTHIIYIYIHTYTICILSAFILYFCGISNFRCMLRVPRGTVTKISKNKKKIVLFLPLLSVQTGGCILCEELQERPSSAKLDWWPDFLDGSSTASVPATSIYCLGRRVPRFVFSSAACNLAGSVHILVFPRPCGTVTPSTC